MMDLWVVGKVTNYDAQAWEFIGVFDDQALALAVCRDEWYFIGPAQLNHALPHDTVNWDGAYYPQQVTP